MLSMNTVSDDGGWIGDDLLAEWRASRCRMRCLVLCHDWQSRTRPTVVTLDRCQHLQSSAKRLRSGPTRNNHSCPSLPTIRSLFLSLVLDLSLPAGAPAVILSSRTQRHSYADAADRALKRLGSLSLIARISAAALLFTSVLAGLFRLGLYCQRRIHRELKSTYRLANPLGKRPIALPCRRAAFVPSSKLKAEATSMQSLFAVRWA